MSMMAKMTIASTGIRPTNTSAAWESTVKAIAVAPKTINGERMRRRSVRLTPF